jgi:hypothetical protein
MPVKRFFPTSVSHPITSARLHSTNPLERLHKRIRDAPSRGISYPADEL